MVIDSKNAHLGLKLANNKNAPHLVEEAHSA